MSFIHVYDVCTTIDTILHKGIIGEVCNIGSEPENELSLLEVSKLLVKNIHNNEDYEQYLTFVKDCPFNDKRYFIKNQKLKQLGWKQDINFIDGIKSLIS
jgi:dTDP-D-glucose 4,6-dehydratase